MLEKAAWSDETREGERNSLGSRFVHISKEELDAASSAGHRVSGREPRTCKTSECDLLVVAEEITGHGRRGGAISLYSVKVD